MNYVLTKWIPEMYKMNTSDLCYDIDEYIRWLYGNHILPDSIGMLHIFTMQWLIKYLLDHYGITNVNAHVRRVSQFFEFYLSSFLGVVSTVESRVTEHK